MLATSAIKIISNEFGDCLQKLVGGLGKDQDKRSRDLAKGLIDTLKDTKATMPRRVNQISNSNERRQTAEGQNQEACGDVASRG